MRLTSLTSMMRSCKALSLALFASLAAWTAWAACSGGPRPVVVGSKNFTEQVILGEIVAQLLEAHDVPVDRRLNLGGSFICHQALVSGGLDIYVEYTGTALTAILRQPFDYDAQKVYDRVRDVYRDDLNLEWSAPLGFNNTFAIIMTRARAGELGATKISDLAEHQTTIRPGAGHEFLEREDGLRGLTEAYELEFSIAPRGMELGLVYQALVEGQVDFVAGNSTDGLIEKFNLVVLEDDRGVVSAGLPVSANATNEDVGVHTKVSLNVRHRVVSPAASPKELHLSKSGSNSSTRAVTRQPPTLIIGIRPASRGNKNGVTSG